MQPCLNYVQPVPPKPVLSAISHSKSLATREGQDYEAYLSQKTRSRREKHGGAKKKPCSKCGRFFARLDTHIRTSATCREILQSASDGSPASSAPSDPQSEPLPVGSPLTISAVPLKRLRLPKSNEEWAEADHLLSAVALLVLQATTAEEKNARLCKGIYDVLANRFESFCRLMYTHNWLFDAIPTRTVRL